MDAHIMSATRGKTVVGVVLYRNPRRELELLLESIEAARASSPPFELLWFDNSVDAASAALFGELGLEVRSTGQNLGFGSAHNQLMREAFGAKQAAWYLCLNPDAAMHPDMLRRLVERAEATPNAGLVEATQFPDEHPKAYDPLTGETAWCSGCALLVSRALFEKVGGFDDNIFLYCEDVDLSWRARAAGFRPVIEPRALVAHYAADREFSERVRIEMLKAGAYLAKKFGNDAFHRECVSQFTQVTGSPPVLPVTPRPTDSMRAVADFSAAFHFARARW